ncbi:hypothetical protein [Streptomyces parvus]|uniref:hypothetical protein n=1 Tax=Streptomyces parvus TaxID=66428 RepID=UPI0036AB4AA1
MPAFAPLSEWAASHLLVIASVAILAAVLITVAFKRRASQQDPSGQEERRKFSAGTLAAVFAFIVCTSVSLNTGFRFTGDAQKGLGMTSMPERILACAAFESLIAMCVLGARERMARKDGDHSPGWYGSAVWIFAALSAVPAWAEGGGASSGTLVRIIVGSFGSALAAHSALGLELRHRTGGESQTAMAQIMRDVRERLMARLGLAHRSRSAEEIARDRALDKAVDLYDQYARLSDDDKGKRKGAKMAGRLAVWQDRAELATDEAQRDLYRARVAQRQYATALHISDSESPWSQPSRAQVQASALDELEEQARRMEDVAAVAEAAVWAQIGTPGTPPTLHDGTYVPSQRDETVPDDEDEPAECIDQVTPQPVKRPAELTKTAAAHGGTSRVITARVPREETGTPRVEQPKPDPLRDLRSYPTKRASLEALYERRIKADDTRTTNAIAEELLSELANVGIKLDRGAANRYIAPLRPQHGQDRTGADDRDLIHA